MALATNTHRDHVCLSVFGYGGPNDKLRLRVDPYEWYLLRTEYQQRHLRPPGYTVEILDTDGDEFYMDLHGISAIWKHSPQFEF